MGANQGKENTVVAGGRTMIAPPPATVQALQALLKPDPSKLEHHTLDRTLKGFLKHCNLGGLEYRLRLAGIYSLEDLVRTDEAKLCRHGFTRLMAKRLFTALDEYLLEPDEIPAQPVVSPKRRPSEMVLKVQQPFTRVSTLMRGRQNFGKMNIRRYPSTGKKTPPPKRKKRPLSLRVPNKVDNEQKFLVSSRFSGVYPEVVLRAEVHESGDLTSTTVDPDSTQVDPDSTQVDPNSTQVNPNSTQVDPDSTQLDPDLMQVDPDLTQADPDLTQLDPDLTPFDTNSVAVDPHSPNPDSRTPEINIPSPAVTDDIDDIDRPSSATPIPPIRSAVSPVPTVDALLQEPPLQIERCLSVPTGIHRLAQGSSGGRRIHGKVRRYASSPSLFDSLECHAPEETDVVRDAINVLKDALNQLDDVVAAMYLLLEMAKEGYWLLRTPQDIEWIIRSVDNYLQDLELVEVACRVLKYVTYQALQRRDGQGEEERFVIEPQLSLLTCEGVVNALKLHPHSQRVQLNGSLTLANLLRIDVTLGGALMEANIFSLYSTTLQLYGDNEIISLAMLSALASFTAALSVQEYDIIILSADFQKVLTETANVMTTHGQNMQLQNFSLSFITLALIDVAAQLDTQVMRVVVKAIVQSVNRHITDADIAVWGCKAISQIASHEVLQEESIVETITDCTFRVLSEHPKSSRVQMWASYALYQQVSYNRALLPLVQDTGIIQKCQDSLPHLSNEAQSYLQSLTKLTTV